jgi:hypothetical protein
MELLNYLETTIKESIVFDVIEIAEFHSSHPKNNGGWFGIPRQVFCYIDILGAIAYRNNKNEDGASTRKAIRFLNEFFPKDYSNFSDILIAMWRHGTVHNFKPYEFYIQNGRKKLHLKWSSNRSNENHNRAVHMKTFRHEDSENYIYVSINICQLADDLLTSLENLISKIKANRSFYNGCQTRLNKLLEPRNCLKVTKVGKRKREVLRDQILSAKTSCKGIIKRDKNIQWY